MAEKKTIHNYYENYYEVEFDGEYWIADLTGYDPFPFFRAVGAEIAMDDCTGVHVTKIVYNYTEYVYAGWRPGMEYTFIVKGKPEDEKHAYTVWLPEYDH